MPSSDTSLPAFDPQQRQAMLHVARESIRHGLSHRAALPVRLAAYDGALRERRATFVTLYLRGELRGCIGVLEPIRPLIADVAENAYAAAFRDPRFPPLTPFECDGLETHISILSPAEPLCFRDEADLIDQLRPGVDGLILQEGRRRGTFLPTVWETIRDPRAFLQQLKLKAGLPPDYWSQMIHVSRYSTESVS